MFKKIILLTIFTTIITLMFVSFSNGDEESKKIKIEQVIENPNLYIYKIKIIRWIDGDTVDVNIDLGYDVRLVNQRIRLAIINAWEKRGVEKEKGIKAWNRAKELLPEGSESLMRSIRDKKGKYGRYLGVVFTKDGKSVGDILLKEGHAKKYKN